MRICWSFFLIAGIASARTEFWSPVAPPRAHYTVEVTYLPAASRLEGTETIRFRNSAGKSIGRIALQWFGDSLTLYSGGTPLSRSNGVPGVALFDLPRDLAPGADLTLSAAFAAAWPLDQKTNSAVASIVVVGVRHA